MKKYVITGGPGIGKTTIIEHLASKGFLIVPEAAREIIEEETVTSGETVPWKNLKAFQERVAKKQLDLEAMIHGVEGATPDIVFLDRGLIDGHGYCKHAKIETPQLILDHGRERYEKVFLLNPLPVYKNDQSRLEGREEARRIHIAIENAYREFGYNVIPVPGKWPNKRLRFILANL